MNNYYNFNMLTLCECAICLFFVLPMFSAFHLFCLISIDKTVTYFYRRVKND